MSLVGLSGILAPRLRPELYLASTSQKSIGGVPLVSIAGLGVVITGIFIWWAYLHYHQLLANANMTKLLAWTCGHAVLGLVMYFVVSAIRMSQRVDVELSYREIPPE